MVTESDVKEMWQYVNAGFTIELIPYYMKKEKSAQFIKTKQSPKTDKN